MSGETEVDALRAILAREREARAKAEEEVLVLRASVSAHTDEVLAARAQLAAKDAEVAKMRDAAEAEVMALMKQRDEARHALREEGKAMREGLKWISMQAREIHDFLSLDGYREESSVKGWALGIENKARVLSVFLASAPDTATPKGEDLRKEAEAIMEHAHNPVEYVAGLFQHFEKQLCDCADKDAAFKNRAHHVNCKGWGPRWAWEKHLPEAVIVERARALGLIPEAAATPAPAPVTSAELVGVRPYEVTAPADAGKLKVSSIVAPMRLCVRCSFAVACAPVCSQCGGETLTGDEVRLAIIGSIDGMPQCTHEGCAQSPLSHTHRRPSIARALDALGLRPEDQHDFRAWSARFPALAQRTAPAPVTGKRDATPCANPECGCPKWLHGADGCGGHGNDDGTGWDCACKAFIEPAPVTSAQGCPWGVNADKCRDWHTHTAPAKPAAELVVGTCVRHGGCVRYHAESDECLDFRPRPASQEDSDV